MTPRMYALWMAQPVLQAVVVGVLLWRKRHRTFPVFFAYLVSQVVVFAATFVTFQMENYPLRFYTYWVCQAISLAIGFKVIQEVFLDVFRPYPALKDLGAVLFKWAALVMLLVAGVVAAASSVSSAGPLVQAVLTVERCVRVVQVGLIMFLLVFAKYLGVSWKQQSFGIALGFGEFAAFELIVVALRASGHIGQNAVDATNMIAYNCSVLVWLGYALANSPAKDLVSTREVSVTTLVSQRWNQSLNAIHNPMPADSLIPMFEGMVDQALSRTHRHQREDVEAAAPAPQPAPKPAASVPVPAKSLATKA